MYYSQIMTVTIWPSDVSIHELKSLKLGIKPGYDRNSLDKFHAALNKASPFISFPSPASLLNVMPLWNNTDANVPFWSHKVQYIHTYFPPIYTGVELLGFPVEVVIEYFNTFNFKIKITVKNKDYKNSIALLGIDVEGLLFPNDLNVSGKLSDRLEHDPGNTCMYHRAVMEISYLFPVMRNLFSIKGIDDLVVGDYIEQAARDAQVDHVHNITMILRDLVSKTNDALLEHIKILSQEKGAN